MARMGGQLGVSPEQTQSAIQPRNLSWRDGDGDVDAPDLMQHGAGLFNQYMRRQ